MSLINQVLNDLEKRGANGPLVEMPIRAVPLRNKSRIFVFVAIALLLVGAAIVIARAVHKNTTAPQASVTPTQPAELMSVSQVIAATAVSAELQVSAGDASEAESFGVASRLSFELNSIPMPNSLRGKPLAEGEMPSTDIESSGGASKKSNAGVHFEPSAAVTKQMKKVSPQQQAENEYRKANLLAQQGQLNEAAAGYDAALHFDPLHIMAREALVAVLLEGKQNAEAERVLQEGLKQDLSRTHLAMLLARLQVERNAVPLALETLEKSLSYAEHKADYQAFVAALLQRQNHHKEAITHYQIALQLSPSSGLWFMGLGISMQAVQRKEEALDAYKRALDTRSLSPELQAYVAQRIKEVKS